jgi:hypothetical protein
MELEFEELDLDLSAVSSRGRSAKVVDAQYARDLTPADLNSPKAQVQTAKPLAKIRDAHHALARVLATGAGEGEASAITGYSPSRISILKADPQFQELLEFYRNSTIEGVADFRQRMLNLGLGAVQELTDRLDENPESFSPALLKDIAKDMADRTGHAPAKGPNLEVHINAPLTDRIRAARARVESLAQGKTIDHE